MLDVVAIGELLIDFSSIGKDKMDYPIMNAHPGGAPANFLSALANFKKKTALIGKVGNDMFGKMLIKTLADKQINTTNVYKTKDAFTTLAFVDIDKDGNRNFSFSRNPGADTLISYDEVDLSLIDECKIFHFGTLSLTNNPSKMTTKRLVKYAKKQKKIISFDPNLRIPLWNNLDDARKEIMWGLNNSDIVKISDDEVFFLFNMSPSMALDYIYKCFNLKALFITCGASGCYYINKKGKGFVDSIKDIKVIDTTGAGDIFFGTAISKIIDQANNKKEVENIDLKPIVTFATISAGLSTTKEGGISSICSEDKILEYLEEKNKM